nr:hypothetical protein [Tanacetum cinerariifolium]
GVAETMGSGGFGFGGKGGKVLEVEDGLLKSLGVWQGFGIVLLGKEEELEVDGLL